MFNVADMGLTVGVVLFLVYFIAIYKEPKTAKPTETVTELDTSAIEESDERGERETPEPIDNAEQTAAVSAENPDEEGGK